MQRIDIPDVTSSGLNYLLILSYKLTEFTM